MTETPTAAAQAWLARLDSALQRRDVDAALELFDDECFWRDFVAFTWNLKTLEGKADIRRMSALPSRVFRFQVNATKSRQ